MQQLKFRLFLLQHWARQGQCFSGLNKLGGKSAFPFWDESLTKEFRDIWLKGSWQGLQLLNTPLNDYFTVLQMRWGVTGWCTVDVSEHKENKLFYYFSDRHLGPWEGLKIKASCTYLVSCAMRWFTFAWWLSIFLKHSVGVLVEKKCLPPEIMILLLATLLDKFPFLGLPGKPFKKPAEPWSDCKALRPCSCPSKVHMTLQNRDIAANQERDWNSAQRYPLVQEIINSKRSHSPQWKMWGKIQAWSICQK